MAGDGGAQQVHPLRLGAKTRAKGGEALLAKVRQEPLAPVRQHPVDGALDQLLEVADHLVHADAAALRLRHRDFLDGVLQLHARGVELLDEVRTVQQLEGGGAVAGEPGLEQPPDPVARMDGVEIGGADAGGAGVLHRGLALLGLRLALAEDGDGLVAAGFRVADLLGHLHGDHA